MQPTKKIPTLIGIIFVILLLAGVGFVFEYLARGQSKATASIDPQQVTVTNVSDSSFTLVWQTGDTATGTILVSSPDGKKYSAFDERDASGKMGKYVTHSITVRTLQPETNYTITILSNGKKYPVEEKKYQVTTFPSLSTQAPPADPAYGVVKTATDAPAEGTIIFLNLDGSQTLSSLVRSSGSWVIPLNLIRTQDGSSYLPMQDRMTETISAKAGTVESAVTTDTLNDGPVPDIILGQSYDFRGKDVKKTTDSVLATAQNKTSVLGASTTSTAVTLTAPAQGANLTAIRPLITGLGIPGKTITITLGLTNPQIGSTTVGKDGQWNFTPKTALAAGKQRVTITTVDKNNKPVAITHTFTILKSGSQVLGDATPSATITDTPLVTPTLEATPSNTPIVSTIAAQPIPTTGSFLPTMLLLLTGTFFLIGGGAFLFSKN